MVAGMTQPAAAAAQPGSAAAPAGALSRTQYLSLLANSGKLSTAYGAAPPWPGQSPTGAMGPNVTNAFLAALVAGKSTPYLSTLRNVQGGELYQHESRRLRH